MCSIAWSSAKLEKIFKDHQKESIADRDKQNAQREQRLAALSKQLTVANILPDEFKHHSVSDAHRKADYFFTTPSSPIKVDSGDCEISNKTQPDTDETAPTGDKGDSGARDTENTPPTSKNTETADVAASRPTTEADSTTRLRNDNQLQSLNIGDPWIELMECMKNRFVDYLLFAALDAVVLLRLHSSDSAELRYLSCDYLTDLSCDYVTDL